MFSIRNLWVPALLMLFVCSKASAELDTEARVQKYGQDLASAWSSYPMEKDITVRKQKINDLSLAMGQEIQKLDAPNGITIQRAVDNFLSNLQKARGFFRQEKMSGERLLYVVACGNAFRREISQATDLKDDRTATKCFEMLTEWADNGRTALRTVPDEVHPPFYSAITEVFQRLVKLAAKDAGDPTEIYDKQLKEIHRKFPATGVFEKTNGPVAGALETAAKAVNTRNKAP